jgi:polyhydroxyalkanoate synthesis regulator phasin
MKKFVLSLLMAGIFFCIAGARDAHAGSCADPVYLATHIDACWDEFETCFEGYDGFWDAVAHTDDIVLCIADALEEEASELVEDIIEDVTGEDDSAVEEVASDVMDFIFGLNNQADAIVDNAVDKWTDANQKIRERLADLIEQAKENRRGAKEKLKSFIKKLLENRRNGLNRLGS